MTDSPSLLIPLSAALARLNSARIFAEPRTGRWLLARLDEGRFGGAKIGREYHLNRAEFEAWLASLRTVSARV